MKIVQIEVSVANPGFVDRIYCLTNDGQMFYADNIVVHGQNPKWARIYGPGENPDVES